MPCSYCKSIFLANAAIFSFVNEEKLKIHSVYAGRQPVFFYLRFDLTFLSIEMRSFLVMDNDCKRT